MQKITNTVFPRSLSGPRGLLFGCKNHKSYKYAMIIKTIVLGTVRITKKTKNLLATHISFDHMSKTIILAKAIILSLDYG